jgi:serpin B
VNRQSKVIVTVVTSCLLFFAYFCGCLADQGEPAGEVDDETEIVRGNTEFALDLYGRLRTEKGNLFLSPYSISSALAMTYAGARGNTAAQMADVLRFRVGDDVLHKTFNSITQGLNQKGKRGDFELSVANALWGQEGYSFLDSLLELNEKHYGAGMNLVDFARDAEGARRIINAWVEKETRDKIKDLIKPGVLNRDARLVLTNAIYFKGIWASQFDTARTRDEPFWLSPDTSVTVPMMHQTEEFGYMETETLQALELPYRGDALSMLVLLPKQKGGLPELEPSLSAEALAMWLKRLAKHEVIVSLPRFSVTAEFSLAETLKTMGMAEAFVPGLADLSGTDGTRDLFISAVVHKAFVDVNEEGSEAAAATAVVEELEEIVGPGPSVFRADHPFLFIIRDNESGSILFMGRLVDPKT